MILELVYPTLPLFQMPDVLHRLNQDSRLVDPDISKELFVAAPYHDGAGARCGSSKTWYTLLQFIKPLTQLGPISSLSFAVCSKLLLLACREWTGCLSR